MNDQSKRIIDVKKSEIAKAGRMFFEAVFGDTNEFARKLNEELEDAEGDEDAAQVAPQRAQQVVSQPDPPHDPMDAPSIVRCSVCTREQSVPAHVDVFALKTRGWTFVPGAWTCPFCARR